MMLLRNFCPVLPTSWIPCWPIWVETNAHCTPWKSWNKRSKKLLRLSLP